MKQTAIFPGRYVQSQGALADLGDEISRFGTKALAIAGETAKNAILPPFSAGMAKAVFDLAGAIQRRVQR